MKKNNWKKIVSEKVANTATYYAKNSVGKSTPLWQHEVAVPKEVKELLEKES